MKVLKALLAIFTFLAAALTCTLLFVQDRNAPHYILLQQKMEQTVQTWPLDSFVDVFLRHDVLNLLYHRIYDQFS